MSKKSIIINAVMITITMIIIGLFACKNIHPQRNEPEKETVSLLNEDLIIPSNTDTNSTTAQSGSETESEGDSEAVSDRPVENTMETTALVDSSLPPAGNNSDISNDAKGNETPATTSEQGRVNEIIGQIVTPGMDTLEKIKAVHDYLVKNIYYDTSLNARGIYNTLFNHIAVCTGYSETFKLFMDTLGIPCVLVTGYGNGTGHEWNAIQLDGAWYHIDVTWDDPLYNGSGSSDYPDGENMQYTYFLVPTVVIKQDHTISSEVGTSTSTQYHDWVLSAAKADNLKQITAQVSAKGINYAVVTSSADFINSVGSFFNNNVSDFYIIHDRSDSSMGYGNYPATGYPAIYNTDGYIYNSDYEAFRLTDAVRTQADLYAAQGYAVYYVYSQSEYEQHVNAMQAGGMYCMIFSGAQVNYDSAAASIKKWYDEVNYGYSMQSGSITGSNGTVYFIRMSVN